MEALNDIEILVVDDDEGVRKLMTKILAKAGYSVHTAADAKEARELLRSREIDMVLTDAKMPDAGGFELLKEIKKNYPGIAVIMMTARADSYTIKDALILGADEYITKPFKQYEVTVVLERAYWRSQSLRNQQQKS